MQTRSIVLTVAALLTLAVGPARAGGADPAWPQDGYGPGNTGYNPAETRLNLASVQALRLRWTATPAPGEEGCATPPGPPLVAGGRVVLPEGGGVGARDVRTGARLWLRDGFSLLGARLAVGGGLVLVTSSSCYSQSNYDGKVTALSLATGATAWEARLSGTVDELVLDGGTVVVHGFCHLCDDDRDQVAAYRVADGVRLWRRDHAELAGEVAAGGRVLLTDTRTPGTQAVAVATGVTAWRTKLAWQAWSATPDGAVFLAADGTRFGTLSARTGRIGWTVTGDVRSLSSDGRRVFASGTALTAYATADGRRSWTRKLTGPGKPIRAGGLLYVTTEGPALAILYPVTGATVAPGTGYRTAREHVVVTGGRLFTTDGTVVRAYAG